MILVTGATGLFGKHLMPLLKDAIGIGSKELDITNEDAVKNYFYANKFDLVVHLAAYTDVAKAEKEIDKCIEVNVRGTYNLAKYAKRLLYISTEYVFDGEQGNYKESDLPSPVNIYSKSKFFGEQVTRAYEHKVIRLGLKPRPYEHQKVPGDMYTSGDYVDVIAIELALAIEHYDELPEILNIGTGRKRLIDLARQTRDDVVEISRDDIPTKLPKDTSLDLTKWEKLKNEFTK